MSGNEHLSRKRFHGLWALTNRELKKWYKEPFILFMSIVQPIIWIGLFGKAMNIQLIFSTSDIPIPPNIPDQLRKMMQELLPTLGNQLFKSAFGTSDYFSFMTVGMLSFVILFTTMFSGMSIVWDRRLGFLNKVLSTPVPRSAILLAKIFAAVARSMVQVVIVLVAGVLLGLKLNASVTPLNILGAFSAIFLMCIGFASLFLMIAIRSTRWETQVAIMNLLNLPLLFASNALFPVDFMPEWIQVFSKINPISYCTDAARQLLLYTPDMGQLIIDFTFLGVFAILFTTIGIVLSWRYLSK